MKKDAPLLVATRPTYCFKHFDHYSFIQLALISCIVAVMVANCFCIPESTTSKRISIIVCACTSEVLDVECMSLVLAPLVFLSTLYITQCECNWIIFVFLCLIAIVIDRDKFILPVSVHSQLYMWAGIAYNKKLFSIGVEASLGFLAWPSCFIKPMYIFYMKQALAKCILLTE